MAVARYSALALLAFLVSPIMVMATPYEVDWSVGVDFTAFATQNHFYAGDVLNFHYDRVHNNVVIATNGDEFDQCEMEPNLGYYQSGNEVFTLPEAGYYYFMCGYHCKSHGMRITVFVN
ncbi:hypothetical protein ACLB2K_074126 [Fragaria x ananassa]